MKAVDDALFTRLTGDTGPGGVATLATGGIRKAVAGQGQTYPFLTYQDVSGTPEYTLTSEAYRRLVYRFKAYNQLQNWAVPDQIIERVEVLLIDQPLTVAGWKVDYFRLRNRLDSMELDNGIIYPFTLADFDIGMSKI